MKNNTKFCPHCGTENKKDAAFCANCGQSMTINQPENKEAETKEKRPVNKKRIGIIGAVIAIFIIIGGVFAYINAQPKSILNALKVNFSGYNSQGTVELLGDYQKKEIEIIGAKVGLPSSEVKKAEDSNIFSFFNSTTNNSTKWQKFAKYFEDTRINISHSQNLSNGQKVTLKITTTLKDNPIKEETKTYTVKNLKKATTYTIESVLKDNPVSFTGFNHFGSVKFDDDKFTVNNDNSAPTDLTNSEQIIVRLSQDYINQQKSNGKILSGTASKTLTVADLESSPKISNLNDLLTQEDTVVRADNESSTGDFGITYTVTRMDSYFVGTNISSWGYSSSHDSDKGEFSVVTIYKIVSHYNSDTDTKNDSTSYYSYGYTGLTLNNGKVDVSDLTGNNKYKGGSSSSEQAAVDQLKSDYSSATKLN
ncbi:zinc ribbon domain-containing protein [Lactococcus cremoris]|uniref:zinc ribbon domain-containing protein n=1 Tax=Lactococcus lactis subsp. cremoris TaxID=1359 RepID=UPI0024A6E19C|nr:zinc ribbon domain-containing protein [Lactococcus cremoris]